MDSRKVPQAEWQRFFDASTRNLNGKGVEIEVASLDIGDQIQADWLPLLGLVYDPKGDVFEIALDGLDHLIAKPREIFVLEEDGELAALEVIDADGVRHVAVLKDPLMLPAPHK